MSKAKELAPPAEDFFADSPVFELGDIVYFSPMPGSAGKIGVIVGFGGEPDVYMVELRNGALVLADVSQLEV
jgi:hypothetical protein